MCVPHDCLVLSFKTSLIQKVKLTVDFLNVLAGLRRVCGIVTEFISVLRAGVVGNHSQAPVLSTRDPR